MIEHFMLDFTPLGALYMFHRPTLRPSDIPDQSMTGKRLFDPRSMEKDSP